MILNGIGTTLQGRIMMLSKINQGFTSFKGIIRAGQMMTWLITKMVISTISCMLTLILSTQKSFKTFMIGQIGLSKRPAFMALGWTLSSISILSLWEILSATLWRSMEKISMSLESFGMVMKLQITII